MINTLSAFPLHTEVLAFRSTYIFLDQVFSSVLALNRVTDWENKCLVNPFVTKIDLISLLRLLVFISMGWYFPLQRICYSETILMLCQKKVRCDIQHFCDGSYTRSYYNDLYLTELSEDQVLIPPECSPNWKVQEKTWSLIGSDQKRKKKRRLGFKDFGRFNCGKFRCVIWLYSETCGLISSKTYVRVKNFYFL